MTSAVKSDAGFVALPTTDLRDWRMAGLGRFNVVSEALESEGGPGILWYAREPFANFVLRVAWRVSSPTDNSGIFIRIPALDSADTADDWKPAVEHGYEIQIDDAGLNPETQTYGDPLHRTGAIYGLAPATRRTATRPVGDWNNYEITARKDSITVALNGLPISALTRAYRRAEGYIGLQNHDANSRVQFRNLYIMRL